MARRSIYCCLTLLLTPAFVQCISVVGPRMLRPHSPYRVALAGGPRTDSIYVAIEGRRANGEQFTQGKETQVQSGSSRVIDIEIGDPGPGSYLLIARSTSGPKFSSSAPVVYQPRSFCVFIQTDKRVYQPGDTISFRIITLDKYLLPLSGNVDISILDTGGTPVRQWAGAPLDRGLVTAELPLDTEPALGEWTLKVELRGQTYSRKVLIADYILPKFNIELDTPKQVLFSEGKFNLNITAKHFNGLPVRGELTIAVYAVFFSGVLQPVFSSPNRKVISFDGKAQMTYDLKTDLDLAEDAARPLVIEAVLEEKNTLVRQNVTTRIVLLRTPYRLRVTAPEFFKPTLPYYIQIEVVSPSGDITKDEGDVTVERIWDDGAPANISTVNLKNGLVVYSFTPDAAHANSTLNIVIKYKEVTERIVNVRRSTGARGQHLSVEIVSRNVGVGGQLRARVLATEPMDLLHYAVIGRGDVLLAKTVELSPARKNVDFSIPVSSTMAPGVVLLTWYPRLDASSNDVLAASIYAPVDKLLQHEVTLSISNGAYRPGGSVQMKVSGGTGAHAAILGEDEKAIQAGLAGTDGLGHGFTLQMIKREIESFSGLSHSVFKNEGPQPGLGTDLGGNSTADVFHNAGVVILSDGVINRNAEASPTMSPPETGTRPPLAGPYAFSRLPPPPAPRYYLTTAPQSTWMLANFSLNNDGTGGVNRVTPMALGKWSVGAFAIHPTLGLGLATPKTITTSKVLDITAELPAALQRGETLAAVITLSSTLSVDSSIEMTFHNSEQYFEFEPLQNDIDSTKKVELFRRLRLSVPAKGSASTAFLITAVRTGEAPIIIEASGNGVSASLFRTIDVKDGYEEELWSWSLLDARRGIARANVSLWPAAGTKVGTVSLRGAGDLMAPALYAAMKMDPPSGDPAHALRPLAVACVLLQYLEKTERDEPAIQSEMRARAAVGYQRLMAYRRKDGSFSSDMSEDAEGDVWMTAMATRWLSRAVRYVSVSPEAVLDAARWLGSTQRADGSWPTPAARQRHHQRAQQDVALTAHALLALIRVQGFNTLNTINKAEDYIAKSVSDQSDTYTLAIAACALAAVNNPRASYTLQSLDLHANVTNNMRWWRRQISGNELRNPWLRANNAEAATAAWGLRAMLPNLVDEAVPVARYILSAYQPNDLDPDVLEALAELADAIKTPNKLRVSVTVPSSEEARQFNIDDDNSLIIQTQLVRTARNASASSEGRGLAVIGLSAPAATNVTSAWPRYTLDPRVDAVSTKHRLQLSVCLGFVAQGNETISGYTLLTVQLPSGYIADINTLTELTASSQVTRARLSSGGSRVWAWLKALDARERCVTLAAPRVMPVARQRPGYATLIDLYDSSHRARVFFNAIPAHACDICRAWESCNKVCGAASSQRSPGDYDDDEDKPKGRAKGDASRSICLRPLFALLITFVVYLVNKN